jgi:hypothetical protein
MSDTPRRKRRSGSSSPRFKPLPSIPATASGVDGVGKAELAASCGVGIVVLALIVLIWIVTGRAVQDQRAEIRERAEQSLTGQAATIAETVAHELLVIDQSLTVIQDAWKTDSDSVDLTKWQQLMPALFSVADDLFIADDRHIIRQDILPKAIGQGVGSAYVTFPHGSLEQFQSDGTKDRGAMLLQGDSGLLQGDTGRAIDARLSLMYIIRPLDHPIDPRNSRSSLPERRSATTRWWPCWTRGGARCRRLSAQLRGGRTRTCRRRRCSAS